MKDIRGIFKPGDCVKTKPGVRDPDWGSDIAGWQGRILEFEKAKRGNDTVLIRWDSITLQSMPTSMIEKCEVEGLDWSEMGLDADKVEARDCRDTPRQAEKAKQELERQYAWVSLGEEGKRINQILAGVDPEDEVLLFLRWAKYLKEKLSFPFDAVVTEFQEHGPLRTGDRATVTSIEDVDDLSGIIVDVQARGKRFVFPLCDLEANKRSRNYEPVKDYAVWFANR